METKIYTEEEVREIINIFINKPNYLESIRQGSNSVKRFLFDFKNGMYNKFK